jgi:isopentenyl diphosphate isomerase/L-lactate dehydrogenase-like FMN-dependent dehydrogenase
LIVAAGVHGRRVGGGFQTCECQCEYVAWHIRARGGRQLDGGVRAGQDVLAARGEAGVTLALDIIRKELA